MRRIYPEKVDRERAYKRIEKQAARLELEYRKEIGEEIRKGRKRAGLTQSQFAKRLGTSVSAISRMETGKQNLTLRYIAKVVNTLDRPHDFILRIH